MQKIMIPCVILAGGRSSRLGEDKTQVAFGEENLSQWVFTRLSKICEKVYISTKDRKKFTFDAPFLVERSRIYAPIIGMINAFEKLKTQEILFISVDTPFVRGETLRQLVDSDAPITYAQSEDKAHYLISKWHISLLDTLVWARKSKIYTIYQIIQSHQHTSVSASNEECFNINTQEDYARALEFLRLGAK